jgi:hypothetical protein
MDIEELCSIVVDLCIKFISELDPGVSKRYTKKFYTMNW